MRKQPGANNRRSEQLDFQQVQKRFQQFQIDQIQEENNSENDKDEQVRVEEQEDDPFWEMMKERERRTVRGRREGSSEEEPEDDFDNSRAFLENPKANASVCKLTGLMSQIVIDYKEETKKRTIIENEFFITTSIKEKQGGATDHGFTITDNYDIMAEVQNQDKERNDYMDSMFQKQVASPNRRTVLPHTKKPEGANQFQIESKDQFVIKTTPTEQSNRQQSVRVGLVPKAEDYLDAQFKIEQAPKPKVDVKAGRNTVQIDDLTFKNSLGSKPKPKPFELEDLTVKQPSPQRETPQVQKEPESPEILSENNDELLPEEDEDRYLQEVEKKYQEKQHEDEPLSLVSPTLTMSQQDLTPIEQMRILQSSIMFSVDEMLTKEEKLQMSLQHRTNEESELSIDIPKDPAKEFYQTMHQEVLMKGQSPMSRKKAQFKMHFTKDDWEYKDMLRIVDWNERRHQVVSNQQLKKNSVISLANVQTLSTRIRILSQFNTLNQLSNKIAKEQAYSKSRATCIGLTDDLILIGNTEGDVHMFDIQSEQEYSVFSEKSKDFLGNAVTAMDVHPTRSEYVVLGYERGQIVLIDVAEPKKSLKVIKDHHKNLPIGNIKFCDWQGGIFEFLNDKNANQNLEDKQAWMFISIDSEGRVVLSYINKILFVLKVSKQVIIDPATYSGPVFNSIACRFSSQIHPCEGFDYVPIVAIGSASETMVIEAKTSKYELMMKIERPLKYFNRSTGELKDFVARVPSLSWGFGTTPTVNDKTRSILTIAWGSLIQLVVLNEKDPDFPELKNFNADGFYILRNFKLNETPIAKQPKPTFTAPVTTFKKKLGFQDSLTYDESPYRDTEETKSQHSDQAPIEGEGTEKPLNPQYDHSEAFEIPGLDIEMIQFLSESTIFAVTQSQEFRIINISAFNPGIYDVLEESKMGGEHREEVFSNCPELEAAIRINQPMMKSEYGALYHQTIKYHLGRLVVLTRKNIQMCVHQTWQQSISDFKKFAEDDLVKVFSRALDLYKGKVKGYAGLPDNAYQRETKLKTEIKLLVREIIHQVIVKEAKINQIMAKEQALLGDAQQSSIPDDEIQIDRTNKYQTLIRIAIEFCIELRDPQFLFYDLFLLFKESKLEDAFIHELEPFIMAGKFQEWELPNEVIQNHVIKYYKSPNKADDMENIIINMNLAQCDKKIVLEFIHYAESHFLTTAVLYLYTQVFDKKDVIFSLFDLYKKAGKKNQGNMIDLMNLKEFGYESKERQQVVKSQIYIGFKILWVIRLFLNGRKFPSGKIRTKKWRTFIHDIMETLMSQSILKVLLDIDAESFFQTISIVFYKSKPYELFKMGRIPEPTNNIFPIDTTEDVQPQNQVNQEAVQPTEGEETQGKEEQKVDQLQSTPKSQLEENQSSLTHSQSMVTPSNNNPNIPAVAKYYSEVSYKKFEKNIKEDPNKVYPHADFLKALDSFCMNFLANETHKLNYLFFVADVVAYTDVEGLQPSYYYAIAKELIVYHKRYLEYAENLQKMLIKRNIKLIDYMNKYRNNKIKKQEAQLEDSHYIQVTEVNILNLLSLSEPLDQIQIIELIKVSDDQVKILLLEKKEEHSKWLNMLINDTKNNTTWTKQLQESKAVGMISAKLDGLKARSTHSERDKTTYDQFKREVSQNIEKILLINPVEAIHLVNDKLGGIHKEMIDQLYREPKLQMLYLDILIQEKEVMIEESIKHHGLGDSDPLEAKRFVEFLKLHLRLRCQYKPETVVKIVEKMMKNTYYPIDESLKICQEFNVIEATFKLNRKLGKYFDCIQQGLQILSQKVNLKKLRTEIYFASQTEGVSIDYPIDSETLVECTEFDYRLNQLTKICTKHHKDVDHDKEELMWYLVLDKLFEIASNDLNKDKLYCKIFFKMRLRAFASNLIDVIPLRSFLQHVIKLNKHLRYREYKNIILQMFANKLRENSVLSNANNAIYKVNTDLFHQFRTQTQKGVLFRYRQCPICKQYLDKFLYEEGSTEIDDEEVAVHILKQQEEEEQEEFDLGMSIPLDPKDEPLRVFACKHSFHLRCLDKQNRRKKKSESDEAYRKRIEKQRCPICNLKNYEIEGGIRSQASLKRNTPKVTPKGKGKFVFEDKSSSRKGSNLSGNSNEQPDPRESMLKMRRESVLVSEFNRKLQFLARKMGHYEQQQEFEGLTIKDFKQVN